MKPKSGGEFLRQKAEKIISERPNSAEKAASPEDLEKLVHKLQVHQVELEMQNEELRRSQAVIEESRSKYSDLYDFSPVGYFTFNTAGGIMELNLTGAQMLGNERGHLRGALFIPFVHPDDRKAFRDHLGKVLQTRGKERCELKILKKNGSISYVALESIASANEGSLTIRSAVIDITDRVKAEEERNRLVSVVEQAKESIIITDPKGEILYVNPAFGAFYRNFREGVIGKEYFALMQAEGETRDWVMRMQKAMARCERWTAYITRQRKTQPPLEIRVIVSPIWNAAGRMVNYLIVEEDVSLEIALQERLRKVQKAEALGTMAGGIAHDFNNLLQPIILNTEMALWDVREGSLPSADNLRTVMGAAKRGQALVKQILTFSHQKEQGRKPVEIAALVKEALKFLRAAIPATVEIRERICSEAHRVLADPAQIQQVVMNLVNNAAYSMRDKGGTLEVSLERVVTSGGATAQNGMAKAGPYLRLTVQDTGPGMGREVKEKAFDPFFTTKPLGEGSGMGLAVVHGIVTKHEGSVVLESELGKGTTVTVWLPIYPEAGGREASPEKGEIPRGKERVLLVDDEETQVRTLQGTLERLGYRVVSRTDPQQALEAFRSQPDSFDLVITDQTMPKLPGNRLAGELMRIRPDIPIILCTGFSEMIDEKEARAMGVRHFALKPFTMRELGDMMKRALSRE